MSIPKPWKHQEAGAEFLEGRNGGALFMEMGTGKTRTVIMDLKKRQPETTLVVCPKAVVPVWPAEVEKYAPGEFEALPLDRGSMKARASRLSSWLAGRKQRNVPGIISINYESFWSKDIYPILAGAGLNYIIADESHRIKSAGGKASMGAWQLTGGIRSRPLERPICRCLTGTPMPQNFADVYAQYRFMWPWAFGTSKNSFLAKYARFDPWLAGQGIKKVIGLREETEEEFLEIFEKFSFIVRKNDVLNLPEAVDVDRFFDLTPHERKAYKQMRDECVAEVEAGVITASNAAIKLLRLGQITGGTVKDGTTGKSIFVGNSKQSALMDTLQDIDKLEDIVVFCRFTADIEQAKMALDSLGWRVGELSGKCNNLSAFQDGVFNALVVQIQAGGAGIDLTKARYHIYYSVGYSYGDYDQSRSRGHRPGQTRTVYYIHLKARSTVDEYAYKCLSDKEKGATAILEALKFEAKGE